MEFFIGILCGIALSLFFSFGPAFFSQLQTSIHYGYKRSVPFAFGVSAGDVFIVFLMLTVLKNADMYEILHNVYVASIAAVVMVSMGIYTFRKTTCVEPKGSAIKFKPEDAPLRRTVFLRGFILNFVNPMIWIYWVSVIALLSGELDIPTNHLYLFFVGVLGATLGLDVLKCKLASLLQKVITARVVNIFNKVTGIILFAFAGYLVVSMLVYQLDPVARQKEQEQKKNSTEMIKIIHEGVQGVGSGNHKSENLYY